MKPTLMVIFIFTFLFSACMPATSSTQQPPTQDMLATVTQTTIPTATSFPTPTLIPTPMPDTLYVDAAKSLGSISPLVYGSNYGPWLVASFEMLPQVYDSGVTILRFPGGAWGDHNNVTNLQIDQFVDFIHKVGATGLINVRLLGGTPEQAAEMVRYTNIERQYNIQYWGIGNEPTLYEAELKSKGEAYDTARFNKEWRAFAEAMKKVDPNIKLVGAEINQFSYDASAGVTTNFGERDEQWFIDFLKENGALVDIVSFHRYPFPRSNTSGPPSIDELRQNAQEWDKIIIHARELIHQYTGRDIPMAVTEFNSAYDKSVGGEATPDSLYNAIWVADVLGRMIKNRVFMANHWTLTSKGGSGGWGLVGAYEVYPTYYVYQLYKMFGRELVYSSSDDPDLSIYAARRADGALTIIVINLSTEGKVKAIRIEGQPQVQGEAWLFDASHKAENVGESNISNGISVPAQSMTLFVIP
jgi:hypothetical protein